MDAKPAAGSRSKDLAGYLEALSRPVFQGGISWRVIHAKWTAMREAFPDSDPATVADFDQADVERLLGDPKVVRSKAKIDATIDNAQALIDLDAEHGGFARYLRSHGSFEVTVADLKRQFRFIGDSGVPTTSSTSSTSRCPPYEEWFTDARRPARKRRSAATTKRSPARTTA